MSNKPDSASTNDSGPSGPDPVEGIVTGVFSGLAGVALSVGGVLLVATTMTPRRLSGATSSSRVKWQERQVEIQAAVNSQAAVGGQTPEFPTASNPDPGTLNKAD